MVLIEKLSLSSIRWVLICQGFSHFSAFCDHFLMTKLATSITRVNSINLRWRKEWLCSERPLTICTIVKGWTHARSHWSGISVRSRGNKDQSGLAYLLHYRGPNLHHQLGRREHQFWAISWHLLRLALLNWPAGFKSTCVWPSKVLTWFTFIQLLN